MPVKNRGLTIFEKKARAVAESHKFREIWYESLDPGVGKSKNEWVLTKLRMRKGNHWVDGELIWKTR